MKTDMNRIILLYKELLETVEIEQLEIEAYNLAGIERCFSVKNKLISELKALTGGESPGSQASSEQRAEIESLIRKTAAMNEANAKAVLRLKNTVADRISALKKEKTAFSAYGAYA